MKRHAILAARAAFAFASSLFTAALLIAQTTDAKTFFAPTPCTPREQLFGRDTILAYGPCRDLAMLEPEFRKGVECTLARMDTVGKWQRAMIAETYRGETRQSWLYAQGRTRAGRKVTNAKSALTSPHGYGLAVDVVHSRYLWDNPKFFYSLAQHAEVCGLVAGYFWKSFPDAPHLQTTVWKGAPPGWAREMMARKGRQAVWDALNPPTLPRQP